RGLKRASARLKAFGASVRQMGMKLAKVSAVLAAPFVAGAKVFADFEQQMANVSTMLDEPAEHMGRFTKAIREMAVEFGESTGALAGGLYDILSASIPAEKALDVLTVAVRAAKAGMTDTKTAADAITTILNSYGLAAEHAGEVSDLLFSVVKRGKTTFAELAPQIGMVASTASSAGVGLDELGAALATLTRAGVKTENAVTAVNQIVMSFLKPSKEAAEYARQLGFEMSSATLQSEGLAGVFAKISKLPPDAIAKLFPNVRALRGVIPALKNMAGFTKDIAAMAKRAGATETAYAKMSKTLTHSFNQLKQSALVALSVIGEALAEPLANAAKTIKKYAKAVAEVIANNKAMVVTIAKVIGIVGLVGVSLMAVGYAISTLGTIFGALATVITGVGTAVGILGAVLGAILSPIGLVITAVVALGAYILYATKAGAKALGWLAEKFGALRDKALAAYQGITDALAAGDISLAAKILWLTLKMEWQKGTKVLLSAWLKFKHLFIRIAYGAFYGALAALQIVWHGLEVAWIESTAFLAKVWYRFVGFFQRTWEGMKAVAKKAWTWIKSLFDDSIDTEAVYKRIDAEREAAVSKIKDEQEQRIARREAARQRKRDESKTQHEGTMAEIGRQYEDKSKQLGDEYDRKMQHSEDELKKARKEWREAIEAARKKRPAKEAEDEG
ncbi:MAG: phage tail tape measure protein, partial [Phycisphaerae bacterium]|nr:phage tail tape measure protein [Phycisphaerae bacterium]